MAFPLDSDVSASIRKKDINETRRNESKEKTKKNNKNVRIANGHFGVEKSNAVWKWLSQQQIQEHFDRKVIMERAMSTHGDAQIQEH